MSEELLESKAIEATEGTEPTEGMEPIESAEPTESAVAPDPVAALMAEKEALLAELASVRATYEAERAQRLQREEFCALYPEVDLASLPEEVTAQSALPLAAAYALYERRRAREAARAQAANLENAQKSSGSAHHDGESDGEYSLEQIRRMTPAQVRTRYQTILHSLKKSKP